MTVLLPLSERHNSDDAVLLKAIKIFGDKKQQTVVIEEMAELTQQICKLLIGHRNASRERLIEEFADVLIMLCQLEIIFEVKPEEVESIQRFKLERIKKYMEEE